MDPERYNRLKAAFFEADALQGDTRRSFILQRCASDPLLRDTAAAMLDAEDASDTSDSQHPFDFTTTNTRATPRPDDEIAGFRIVSEIGSGSAGTVYEAEQHTPRRRVALKVLHAGAASEHAMRRFELEADVLARLSHPGIAQIIGSGVAENGQPYIAMELVRGESITRWARRSAANRTQILERFARVCNAVSHAHERGIIHRDLKPANILVDHEGSPKVVDFGIARAFANDRNTMSAGTLQGEVLGTLAYMSPEQAGSDAQPVDVRSDIHALGATLFELITGKPPFDIDALTIGEALARIRAGVQRRTRDINPTIPADLDLIVATATATDRQRRYATARALEDDIRRFNQRQPILAREPSMSYQMMMFAKRRRSAVIAASLAAAALTAATAVSTVSATRAADARAEAEHARAETAAERDEARAVLELLVSALTAAQPAQGRGLDYSLRDFLQDTARNIDPGSTPPHTEATVRTVIAESFISLSEPARALAHLERAAEIRNATLGQTHPETLATRTTHAIALMDLGRLQQARDIIEQTLADAQRTLPTGAEQTMNARHYLASILFKQGDPEASLPLWRTTVAQRLEHSGEHADTTLAAMASLALVLQRLGRTEEAIPFHQRSLRATAETLGEEHPATLSGRHNHAILLLETGQTQAAIEELAAVLETRQRVLPPDHRHIGVSQSILARAHLQAERPDRAEPLATAAHELFLRTLGQDHNYTRIASEIKAQADNALNADRRRADTREP